VETKNLALLKSLELYWGCEINDYSQFPSWIFFTSYLTSFSYENSSQLG